MHCAGDGRKGGCSAGARQRGFMEKLRCVVERITYHNELNGYSVIRCRAKGFSELVTVVGLMPEVHVGSVLVLGGSWKIDAKYGRQFAAETLRLCPQLYMESKNISGAA